MKKYRRDHHTKREKIVAKFIAQHVGGSYVLMDPMCPANCLITDGKHNIRRFLEIKTRDVSSEQYATSIFGERRYHDLLHLSKLLHSPVSLVVAYNDCMKLVDISGLDNVPRETAGRFDRPDDPQARELCLHIPLEMFSTLPLPDDYPL